MKPHFLGGKNKYADRSDISGRQQLSGMELLPPASIGVMTERLL